MVAHNLAARAFSRTRKIGNENVDLCFRGGSNLEDTEMSHYGQQDQGEERSVCLRKVST